jgi:hypothetical protein
MKNYIDAGALKVGDKQRDLLIAAIANAVRKLQNGGSGSGSSEGLNPIDVRRIAINHLNLTNIRLKKIKLGGLSW